MKKRRKFLNLFACFDQNAVLDDGMDESYTMTPPPTPLGEDETSPPYTEAGMEEATVPLRDNTEERSQSLGTTGQANVHLRRQDDPSAPVVLRDPSGHVVLGDPSGHVVLVDPSAPMVLGDLRAPLVLGDINDSKRMVRYNHTGSVYICNDSIWVGRFFYLTEKYVCVTQVCSLSVLGKSANHSARIASHHLLTCEYSNIS